MLNVENLVKHYPEHDFLGRETARTRAVDGISFTVAEGETVGLVGESGCGKSTAARALLRLEEPTAGEVTLDGEPVPEGGTDLRAFRRRAQLVFQDPTGSFDPRMRVGAAVEEPLRIHGIHDAERRRAIVEDILERVGLPNDAYDRYPHALSGGQKQRAALARALVLNPDLLVADEPVSALDVSVQAEILRLLDEIQDAFDLSMLLISHDMGVVRQVCDRVAVMYLGEIVERGPTEAVFTNPQHPYTRALLASVPATDPRDRGQTVELTGDVPDPANPPSGCRFHTRCPEVIGPDGFDISDEEFHGLVRLRARLRGGLTPERAREAARGSVPVHLREEFDLPSELSDEAAEQVLDASLSAFAGGHVEQARSQLREAFATPCEATDPELQQVGEDHTAACLLHDEHD